MRSTITYSTYYGRSQLLYNIKLALFAFTALWVGFDTIYVTTSNSMGNNGRLLARG